MTILYTLPLAQCPCPSGTLLPLIAVGLVGWGLWLAAQWVGDRWSSTRCAAHEAGSTSTWRTPILFAAMAACVLLVAVGVRALRVAPGVELAQTDQPRLIFLGAGHCRPCQAMEPVREALRSSYADALMVEYHDVQKNPAVGHQFGIRAIPTTIYFAPSGKELFRREGFMSEDEIMIIWRELGFTPQKGKAHEELEQETRHGVG